MKNMTKTDSLLIGKKTVKEQLNFIKKKMQESNENIDSLYLCLWGELRWLQLPLG